MMCINGYKFVVFLCYGFNDRYTIYLFFAYPCTGNKRHENADKAIVLHKTNKFTCPYKFIGSLKILSIQKF